MIEEQRKEEAQFFAPEVDVCVTRVLALLTSERHACSNDDTLATVVTDMLSARCFIPRRNSKDNIYNTYIYRERERVRWVHMIVGVLV